jgi:hypothetical protein
MSLDIECILKFNHNIIRKYIFKSYYFLGDALNIIVSDHEFDNCYRSILDYHMKVKWYDKVRIGNNCKIRKRYSNCFDLLHLPLLSLKINSETQMCIILISPHSHNYSYTYKDQLIRLLAYNQMCNIKIYKEMCELISLYSKTRRYMKEIINYHYYYWGRTYLLFTTKQSRNDNINEIMKNIVAPLIIKLYYDYARFSCKIN